MGLGTRPTLLHCFQTLERVWDFAPRCVTVQRDFAGFLSSLASCLFPGRQSDFEYSVRVPRRTLAPGWPWRRRSAGLEGFCHGAGALFTSTPVTLGVWVCPEDGPWASALGRHCTPHQFQPFSGCRGSWVFCFILGGFWWFRFRDSGPFRVTCGVLFNSNSVSASSSDCGSSLSSFGL
jgi:sterol desaturase/sphingolipid hydroxylase (fatty acid hydroxylase superfamily)